jgi:hypothetical protein
MDDRTNRTYSDLVALLAAAVILFFMIAITEAAGSRGQDRQRHRPAETSEVIHQPFTPRRYDLRRLMAVYRNRQFGASHRGSDSGLANVVQHMLLDDKTLPR